MKESKYQIQFKGKFRVSESLLKPPEDQIKSGVSETDPAIWMQLSLADDLGLEEGQVVDVDYPTLRRTLDAVGAPADNSSLEIEVGANLPGDSAQGIYYSDRELATIGITPGKIEKSQEILEHELTHYSDDVQHNAYDRSKREIALYEFSARYGIGSLKPAAIVGGALTAANAVSGYVATPPFGMSYETFNAMAERLNQADAVSVVVALGALAIGSIYIGDKRETRARKAAKRINLPPTFSVQSKM